jgi:DNA repair ATPase RecN
MSITVTEEEFEKIQKTLTALNMRCFNARQAEKKWRLQCEELLKVNTRLEREIKKYKQQEADKLSGFLSIGAVHVPKIDRNYKFKE